MCFVDVQGVGDCNLAMQCLRLCLSADSNHASAYNNLGVLEMRLGHSEQARAFFQAAGSLAPYLFEPHHNYAKLAEEVKFYSGVFVDVNGLNIVFGTYWLLSKFILPVYVTALTVMVTLQN
jgi:tetratricopeptide (TPR) repeat protein